MVMFIEVFNFRSGGGICPLLLGPTTGLHLKKKKPLISRLFNHLFFYYIQHLQLAGVSNFIVTFKKFLEFSMREENKLVRGQLINCIIYFIYPLMGI